MLDQAVSARVGNPAGTDLTDRNLTRGTHLYRHNPAGDILFGRRRGQRQTPALFLCRISNSSFCTCALIVYHRRKCMNMYVYYICLQNFAEIIR